MARTVLHLIVLGLASTSALGASTTWTVGGTVNYFGNLDNTSELQGVTVGDPWSLTLTIDDGVADVDPAPTYGLFYGSITNFQLTYSGHEYSPAYFDSISSKAVAIRNDWDEPFNPTDEPYDGIFYVVSGIDGNRQVELALAFRGPTTTLLGDGLFSENPIGLPWNLDQSELSFRVIGSDYLSGAVSSTVVPIPPAVLLFGSALGLMGVMRRKLAVKSDV